MKRFLLAALLGTAILIPGWNAVNAAPKNPQNYVCHFGWDDLDNDNVLDEGEGHYVKLRLSARGAANHLTKHVGRAGIPDDFTAAADTDCNAV